MVFPCLLSSFPPPPMFKRRTSMFLGLFLLLKSLQRAFVFPTGQRGLRSSTGSKMKVVEIASCQGSWLEAAKLSLDPWSPDCSFCSQSSVLLQLLCLSLLPPAPSWSHTQAICSCWGQPTCAELWSVALVCSHGVLLECH